MRLKSLLPGFLLVLQLLCPLADVRADDTGAPAKALADALSPEKWRQVESSVDRGLAWLASQQQPDGSFPTLRAGQPAVTSRCVLAFLSRGHHPGAGPYGQQLLRAIDFVLSCQKEDGLLCYDVPEANFNLMRPSHTASYNHAISGLMLGEVYGQVTGDRARHVKAAITKALLFSRALQTRPKSPAAEEGGVRYLRRKEGEPDSDLSITAWHLMFYRSARNAEFKVPQEYADEAVEYVHLCWDRGPGMFNYTATSYGGYGGSPSRGMTGAGILSLSLAGEHNTPMARSAGDWLVAHPYKMFGQKIGNWDEYFYSTYYCSQAAAQLGGHYWEKIFPPMVEIFLQIQSPKGAFPIEPGMRDANFGNAYTTAMAVLALTPGYQLLPIYQR